MWKEYFRRTGLILYSKDRVFVGQKLVKTEIDTQTIAKDTMKVMSLAGININKFKSHSTRMVAASKVLNKGVSVDKIMRVVRWKSRSVFDLFYNRSKGLNVVGLILETA